MFFGWGSTTLNLWHHPPPLLTISGTLKITVICWTNHLAMDKLIWITTDISSHLHHSSATCRSGSENLSFHTEKIVRLHISVSDPNPDFIRIQAGQNRTHQREKLRNFMFEEFFLAEGFYWSPDVFCRETYIPATLFDKKKLFVIKKLVLDPDWIRIQQQPGSGS